MLGSRTPVDLGPHRGDVGRDVRAQGPGERPPAYGEVETGRIGVHPGTSTGQARPRVGDEDALDHDDTHQVGSTASATASACGTVKQTVALMVTP